MFAKGATPDKVITECYNAAEEIFGTVEAVKTTSDLFLPVNGKILEFNDAISEKGGDNPGLINEDPYDKGWIVRLEMTDPSDVDDLLSSEAYASLLH